MPGLRRTLPNWLQTIAGSCSVLTAPPVVERSESVDAIVRDLHAMQDEETRGRLSLSKHDRKGSRRSSHHVAARVQHRPAPKAVVHKEPTRAKKRKEKVKSNRSGSKGKGFMA